MTGFEKFAVVIGINQYDRGIPSLETAVPDAEEIAKVLRDEHGYQQIWQLLNQDANLCAMHALLDKVLPEVVTENACLLFYFAGHGIALNGDEGPEGYLILQDAVLGDVSTYLPMPLVEKALTALPCRHCLIILDCCFAGAFRWSSTRHIAAVPKVIHKERYERFTLDPAWQVIASSAHDQKAIDALAITKERDLDPILDIDGQNHSPFAKALLEALQGDADTYPPAKDDKAPGDGIITATELYLYLRDRVENLTLRLNKRQTPGLWSLKKHDKGEYIFLTKAFNADSLKKALPLDELEENNPYRGLKSYERTHSHLFFGRTKLTEKLCDVVCDRPITVVLGASGSGKSSLVKAGLVAHLESSESEADRRRNPNAKLTIEFHQHKHQKWNALPPLRPGEFPLRALNQVNQSINALLTNEVVETFEVTDEVLLDSLSKWSQQYLDSKLLLIVDQAEELVTLCKSEKEREAFLATLVKLGFAYPEKIRIVFTLRSDFEPQIREAFETQLKQNQEIDTLLKAQLQDQIHGDLSLSQDLGQRSYTLEDIWNKARFIVPAMNREELREAIEEPASAQVVFFKPHSLVDQLIDEVAQMPGALPLLSFALSELYLKLVKRYQEAEREGHIIERAIIQADYDEMGGVTRSITQRAEQVYQELLEEHTLEREAYEQTIRSVMLRMVAGGIGELTRRRVLTSELKYPESEDLRVREVVDRFVSARLLVEDQDIAEGQKTRIVHYIEPAHDALVRNWKRLRDWRAEYQETAVLMQRLTSAALDWSEGTGALWTREVDRLARLEKILESDSYWLNQLETQFVKSSLQQRIDELKEAERQRDEAVEGQINALVSLSQTQSTANNQLDALVAAVKAGVLLEQTPDLEGRLKPKVFGALRESAYTIQEKNRLEGSESPVLDVCFSRDGEMIATADGSGVVKLWGQDGALRQVLTGHQADVMSVAFSPDDQLLASASKDHTVKLWAANGDLLQTLEGHDAEVWDVSFSLDGQVLASVGFDGQVKLWKVADGSLIRTIQSHSGNSSVAKFSPDGKTIATGGWDQPPWQGSIKLWSIEDGDLLESLPVDTGFLRSIDFSKDGQQIVCSGDTGKVLLLQTDTGSIVTEIQIRDPGVDEWAMGAKLSPDGQVIASIGNNGNIKLWDVDGRFIQKLPKHSDTVQGLAFSSDGTILATASADKTVKLWNLNSLFLKSFDGQQNSAHFGVSFSPNNDTLASASWEPSIGQWTVKLWSTAGSLLKTFKGYGDSIRTVRFSRDGRFIATASWDRSVKIWTLSGELLTDFLEHTHAVNGVDLNFDNSKVVSAGYSESQPDRNYWMIWNLSGSSPAKIFGHQDQIYRIAFNQDGTQVATASWDRTIKLWNSSNGSLIKTLTGHGSWLYGLAFSPDGQLLASGGKDRTIKIWSTDGELLHTSNGHEGTINDLSFSPDSSLLVSGGDDATVRLWSRDGTLLKTLKGHTKEVYGVSFSPDNKTVASASWDGTIKIWSAEILDYGDLLKQGCMWLKDYLRTNPHNEGNQYLCKRY